MLGIDMTQRKLRFPPRSIPYLEKHRIFELFYELAQYLIQEKPKDHIVFMRNILPCAAKSRDKQRIVFMSPPSFDRTGFAEQIADELHIALLDREKVMFMSEEGSEEGSDLPCCEDELPQKLEKLDFPSRDYDYSRMTLGWFGEDDQSLHLPSPPSGSVSAIIEEEGRLSSGEKGEKSEESDECHGIDDICKYVGIRVCPCKRVERIESETVEVVEEEKQISEESFQEIEAGEYEGEGKIYDYIKEEKVKKKKKKVEEVVEQPVEIIQKKPKKERKVFGCSEKGWILVDFPSNAKEAERLSYVGLIPTHALRIITEDETWEQDRNYKWNARAWSEVYKSIPVTEIVVGKRNVDELVGDIIKILRVMPHKHPPMLPRIALIGSRGSGTTTQAAKLVEKYGLVHVNFEAIIAQALLRDDDEDELSRRYKQQLATEVDPEIEAAMLERAVLTPHCLKRGWVLTGYPKNLEQMRMLDLIATPPNRTIFLDVPPRECFIRLYYRKYDPCTGEEYKIPKIQPCGLDDFIVHDLDENIAKNLQEHPKNNKKQIIYDIENYYTERQQMIDYCGRTAALIDGNKPIDTVFELIDQILINSSPAHPPRKPLDASTDILRAYIRLEELRKEAVAVSDESVV